MVRFARLLHPLVVDKLVNHISAKLRAARVAKKLTQEDLAERLGMATESVSHIERGVTVPSLKTLEAAAATLDVALVDLFAGLDSDRPISRRRAEDEATIRRMTQELDDRKLKLAVELLLAVERYK